MKYLVPLCLFATAIIIGCTNTSQPNVTPNAALNGTWKVIKANSLPYERTYKTTTDKLIVDADTLSAKFSSNQIITDAMSESCGVKSYYTITYTIDSDSTFKAVCVCDNPVTTYTFTGIKIR